MHRVLLALLLPAAAVASSTTAWEMNSYDDFVKGTFAGVALSRDGRLSLAPRIDTLFASGQPAIWTVVSAPDGTLYAGTGHRGRVYRIDPKGNAKLIWTAPEPEVFALAVAPDGSVFAGTSPDGKIYRIRGEQAEEYFRPGTKYIWSLAAGADGALYAGTGDTGVVFRITGPGKGEPWYGTGQAHVSALALDARNRVLAGTEPNGILYRIAGKDKAFVLYDANLPEIRSLVNAPDGAVYAAALGGSVAQRANAAATAATGGTTSQVSAPATTITVTEEAQAGIDIKPQQGATQQQAQTAPAAQPYAQPVEMMGVEKSAVYRINPDNTVETLWTSKEENAYDVVLTEGGLLVSTDVQGRIYRVAPDRRLTLVAQTGEGETTRLLPVNGGVVAATATMGKLLRLVDSVGGAGTYTSPVHDAGGVARWGQLSWRGERPRDGRLLFRTRSGNSVRPDQTWSEWSEPLTDPRSSAIASPNARYIQWRAELAGVRDVTPSVTGVSIAYLPQNTPPVVRGITVTTQLGVATAAAQRTAQTATGTTSTASSVYSITVTDSGDTGQATSAGTATQTIGRGLAQQIQITWQAEDPDGDRLIYAVWFRGEEDGQWKVLRRDLGETTITVEGDAFADGKYFFRVVASDRAANPAGAAREAEIVSAPILFDNTPPVVTPGRVQRVNGGLQVSFEAADAASALRRAEYSIDAITWVPLASADGIVDAQDERFEAVVPNVAPGEHLLVFRVWDSANNPGLAKVLVQ